MAKSYTLSSEEINSVIRAWVDLNVEKGIEPNDITLRDTVEVTGRINRVFKIQISF